VAMNSIFKRRSIRKYKNRPIEHDKIEKLLKAAMQAPSASNQQPWEFLVVQNREMLRKLSHVSPFSLMLAETPLAIVLFGDTNQIKYIDYWEQDMGAATQNLLLEAVELDLGAVWLGVAPIKERMDYIRFLFNLTENIKPFAIVSIGYPVEEKKYIDRYNINKVHIERY